MEEEWQTTEKRGDLEGDVQTALHGQSETLPSPEFVKVEKNLASLGFFTPSSKRLRNAQEKSFTITTVADGKRMELKGTIIPSAKYGLPITADQDKWIALCKILTDILRKEGSVTNPISFTSADILRLLRKHRHSGKNYKEVEEWLDVLFSTTIFSEGVVYLANEKRRVKDRFRVFERAVSFGKELPDGKVADKNYVWFSDWQLQNINSNHLLPIDLDTYREIKNHIAKALVPLLQVWLYATRKEGIFEKRYDELCQMLNIQQYRYRSLIVRTLSPSLDELTQFGYLADWKIEKTSDGENYKIMFYHGEKFHRDRQARLRRQHLPDAMGEANTSLAEPTGRSRGTHQHTPSAKPQIPKPTSAINEAFLTELMKRGVAEPHARKILADISSEQPVIAQLEWGDFQVQQSGGRITNPAGFYVSLVSGNVSPPASFETASQRRAREEEERRRETAEREEQDLATEYEWYCAKEINRFIAAIDPQEFAAVLESKRKEYEEKYQTPWMVDHFAELDAKRELGKAAPLMSIEEFKANRDKAMAALAEPSDPSVSKDATMPIDPPARDLVNGSPEESRNDPADLPRPSESGGETTGQASDRETAAVPGDKPIVELASEPPIFGAIESDERIDPQLM